MITLKNFPAVVENEFLKEGIDFKTAVLLMKSDIGVDCVYKDVYVVVDPQKIYILEGFVVFQRTSRRLFGNPVRDERFDTTRFESYSLEDIDHVKAEQQISTGMVTAACVKDSEEPILLFRYSSTYKHEVGIFNGVVTDLKKEGKVNYDDPKYKDHKDNVCPKCNNRYPDADRKVCPKCMDKVKLMKRLAKLFFKYKGYILMVFLALSGIAILGAIAPLISNMVFYRDVLEPSGKYYGEILKLILVMIGVRVLNLLVSLLNGAISAKVAADVTYDLKKIIFENISRLSLSFFTNRQTGGLMTQINNDSHTIYWFFCDGFPYFILNIIQIIVFMAIMFSMNAVLTLYTFITVPLFFVTFKLIFRLFEKLYAKAYSRRRSFNSLISDVINGMRVVKSFAREEDEIKRFDGRSRKSADADNEIGTKGAKIFPLVYFLLNIGTYMVWGVGGYQVMSKTGNMDYPTLMTFVAFFALINGPIHFLADVSNWWSESLNALQRLFEITDALPEVKESDAPVELSEIEGNVEFRNVSFSYVPNRMVLEEVSFNADSGTTLGIVGRTGAGKSTLVNLLTRLYDVGDGEILIDGINVKDLSFDTLRKHVAIVSQETYLFRGSILENIKYACPDADYLQVVSAAIMAGAHQFIIKYPDGYHTQIGFGNKDLSGGERQRISIARAILRNPKILILDEATAAMDTQTERQIQAAINRLSKNRTTIIIAHRLSTLRDADNLIVIENGKMAETGTAVELLKKKGVYHKLFTMQAEALKTIGIEV